MKVMQMRGQQATAECSQGKKRCIKLSQRRKGARVIVMNRAGPCGALRTHITFSHFLFVGNKFFQLPDLPRAPKGIFKQLLIREGGECFKGGALKKQQCSLGTGSQFFLQEDTNTFEFFCGD